MNIRLYLAAHSKGIDAVGQWMMDAGAVGVICFGILNRLLIPTGLHHVINTIAWFVFGEFNGATGDLPASSHRIQAPAHS